MPRFNDKVNLSEELEQIPIFDLILIAKEEIDSRGYSQSTIQHYNSQLNDLRQSAAIYGVKNLSKEFITQHIVEGKHKSRGNISGSILRKGLLNMVAAAVNSPPIFTFERETDEMIKIPINVKLSSYEQHLTNHEKSKDTIISYLQTASKFLHYLERSGVNSLQNITENEVRGFIKELSLKWSKRSMRIIPSHLKIYLSFTKSSIDYMFFLSLRTSHINQPVRAMREENVEALWNYIKSDNGDMRTKAIVTIMLVTGMRPIDVIGLKLDDINWNNDTIGFIQSKTGEYMSIKLFPIMGSTIVRYITEERPKGTGVKNVFLTTRAPYRRLSPSSCNAILKNALKNAGIEFVADKRHCPRALRRGLVSRMVAKGIPVQKAAASIGHVAETSVDLYIELDVKKMRSVCLPIPTAFQGWVQP